MSEGRNSQWPAFQQSSWESLHPSGCVIRDSGLNFYGEKEELTYVRRNLQSIGISENME